MVTGIAVGTALIAVMFFITLLGREVVDSAEGNHLTTRTFNVALVPLAVAFSINIGVEMLVHLNVF